MYCKALILAAAVAGLAGCDAPAPSPAGLQVPTPAADALAAGTDVSRNPPPDNAKRAKHHEAELQALSARADGLKEALDRQNAKLDEMKEATDRKHAALGDRIARLEAERDRRPPTPPDGVAVPPVADVCVEVPPVYVVRPCVVVRPRLFSRWRCR